jgi:hypothetical protein
MGSEGGATKGGQTHDVMQGMLISELTHLKLALMPQSSSHNSLTQGFVTLRPIQLVHEPVGVIRETRGIRASRAWPLRSARSFAAARSQVTGV